MGPGQKSSLLDVKLLLSFTQVSFSAPISSQRKSSGIKSLRPVVMAYLESIVFETYLGNSDLRRAKKKGAQAEVRESEIALPSLDFPCEAQILRRQRLSG